MLRIENGGKCVGEAFTIDDSELEDPESSLLDVVANE